MELLGVSFGERDKHLRRYEANIRSFSSEMGGKSTDWAENNLSWKDTVCLAGVNENMRVIISAAPNTRPKNKKFGQPVRLKF